MLSNRKRPRKWGRFFAVQAIKNQRGEWVDMCQTLRLSGFFIVIEFASLTLSVSQIAHKEKSRKADHFVKKP